MTEVTENGNAAPASRFGAVAIALHWSTALAIAGTSILAWYIEALDTGDQRTALLAIHKSVGAAILMLAAFRLAWRGFHPAPPYASPQPAWQRRAAGCAHGLLYALMIVMPVTGYVSEAARARDTDFFGLFGIPRLAPLDRKLSFYAQAAHAYAQYALYALVAAHVAAALYHQFILRDGLFARMWPRNSRQR